MTGHHVEYRDKLLSDPYRPGYHFAAMDRYNISDPNGAFFADGRYHLMYLYVTKRDERGDHCCWGHVSSADLVHWRHHKDAIGPWEGDNGCYSGGAFADDDGTAYITFWKFPAVIPGKDSGGIALACSKPPYDDWTRIEPLAVGSEPGYWGIHDRKIGGETVHVCCADPSNIWKIGGTYYFEAGNKPVLDAFGRNPDSETRYRGGWTDLFRSRDLVRWEHAGRFIGNASGGEDWPDETEDHMCSAFFPLPDRESDGRLTDKWLETFISHNKGSQYFIGSLEGGKERFVPEKHGRFTWNDRTCFAPEAMLDPWDRQLLWFVLHDDLCDYTDPFDWFGVYTMPRAVWLEDGELHMFPAEEMAILQTDHQVWNAPIPEVLPVRNGRSCRIHAEFAPDPAFPCGLSLLGNPETGEELRVFYDPGRKKLIYDGSACGVMGSKRRGKHRHFQIVDVEEAPFELKPGEKLELDVWVDAAVTEVFANNRQAISRRFYADDPKSAVRAAVIGHGALTFAEAWEMQPSNPY